MERYEIHIGGHVSPAVAATFDPLRAAHEPARTVLTGPLADQAELYGVLDRLQALGLELLELRRLAVSEPRRASTPEHG